MRKYKFGWRGDNGLGERLIQSILLGKKSASVCPAYDPSDVDFQEGEELLLVDKNGTERGVIKISRIEVRRFADLDEVVAERDGMTLPALRDALHFAHSREIRPDEEMRITYFELVPAKPPAPRT